MLARPRRVILNPERMSFDTKCTTGKMNPQNGSRGNPTRSFASRNHTPHWLRGERLTWIERLVTTPGSLCASYFRTDYINTIFDQQRTGKRKNYDRIWRLFTLEFWYRAFITHAVDLDHSPAVTVGRGARSR
jgi:hypothetical protein